MQIPKKILLVDAHPDSESFCKTLADHYEAGARKAGSDIERLNVRSLSFDPVLHYGYRKGQALEPDLIKAQEMFRRADHVVFVFPVWWGGLPGLFKGFIDRTFIRDFSHRFDTVTERPVPLLTGRSASVIYTQGAPFLYSFFMTRDGFWKSLRYYVLEFCGFKPVRRHCIDNVKSLSESRRKEVLQVVTSLGRQEF